MKAILYFPAGRREEAEAADLALSKFLAIELFLVEDHQPVDDADVYFVATSNTPAALVDSVSPVIVLDPEAVKSFMLGTPAQVKTDTAETSSSTLLTNDLNGGVPREFSPFVAPSLIQLANAVDGAKVLVASMYKAEEAFAYSVEAANGRGPRLVFLSGLSGLRDLSVEAAALMRGWIHLATLPKAAPVNAAKSDGPIVPLSHTLTDDNYKVWVHEQVAKGIYQRLGWLASLIGVGGLFALGAAGWAFIELKISTDFETKKDAMQLSIEGNLGDKVTEQVASTLLRLSDVHTKVQTETSKAINDAIDEANISQMAEDIVLNVVNKATEQKRIDGLVERAVNKEETTEKLVKAATEKIQKEGGIQAVILKQVRPRVLGSGASEDPGQRAAALQIMAYFEEPTRFRDTLRRILINETDISTEIYEIALTEFLPESFDKDEEVFSAVIAKYAALEAPDKELAARLDAFVASFPNAHAAQITKTMMRDLPGSHRLLNGLVQMEGDEVIYSLVELATSNDQRISDPGWIGLAGLEGRDFSLDTRIAALAKLWPTAQSEVQAPSHNLARLNYMASKAPTAEVFREFVDGLRVNNALNKRAANHLLQPVSGHGPLLEAQVRVIRNNLEDVLRFGDISQEDYTLLALMLESGDDTALLRALMPSDLQNTSVWNVLADLRRKEEIEHPGFEYLRRLLARRDGSIGPTDSVDVEEFLRRLEIVRSSDDISVRGYTQLLRAARSGSQSLQALNPREVADRLLSLRGEMSSFAFEELIDTVESRGVDEFSTELPRYRERMSREAYAALSSLTVSTRLFSGDAFEEKLGSLRDSMELDAFFELRSAARSNNVDAVSRLLPSLESRMSERAYRTLTSMVSPPSGASEAEAAVRQMRPLMIQLARRILRIKRTLSAELENSVPIVDRTLKNRALVRLLPPANDVEAWRTLMKRLGEITPGGSIKERTPLLVILSQRARETLTDAVHHASHDFIVSATLAHTDWHAEKGYAVDVLVHSIENGTEAKILEHAGQVLATGADSAVEPLAAAISRLDQPNSPIEHPAFVKQLALASAGAIERKLYVRALTRAMGGAGDTFRHVRGEPKVLAEVRSALEAASSLEEMRASLNFAKIVVGYYMQLEDESDRIKKWLELSGIPRSLASSAGYTDPDIKELAGSLLDEFKTFLPWVQKPFDDIPALTSADIAINKAGTIWLRLEDAEAFEHWLKVEEGEVEVALFDEGPYQVTREAIVREGGTLEVFERDVSLVRIRQLDEEGELKPKIFGERRERPDDLVLDGVSETLDNAAISAVREISVGSRFRVTLSGVDYLKVPAVAGGHYTFTASRFGGNARPTLSVINEDGEELSYAFPGSDMSSVANRWIADSNKPILLRLKNESGRFDLLVDEERIDTIAQSQIATPSREIVPPRLAEVGRILPVTFRDGATEGWIENILDKPGLYRVEATSAIEIHGPSGKSMRFNPRVGPGASFFLTPNYFLAEKSGAYAIRLISRSERSAELLRFSFVELGTAPEVVTLSPKRQDALVAASTSIADLAGDGVVIELTDGLGFAKISLMPGALYSARAQLTVGGDLPKIELFSLQEEQGVTPIVIDATPGDFVANRKGEYLLAVGELESIKVPAFLHVVFETEAEARSAALSD